MNDFSEKEREHIRDFEEFRKLIQMILYSHLKLLSIFFGVVLLVIMLFSYFKVTYSSVRYEAQAMLYYHPKQTNNIKPYSAKYVLQMLIRKSVRQQFFQELKNTHPELSGEPGQIRITPIEKNRVLDCFKISVSAADRKTAIALTNAFSEYCIRIYTEEWSANMEKRKDDLLQKKREVFEEMNKIEQKKTKLGSHKQLFAPEKDYEKLRLLIGEQQTLHTKLGLALNGLEHRQSVLKQKMDRLNPALLANDKELSTRIAALKKLDAQIENSQDVYTEYNPKMMSLQSRRASMHTSLEQFMKEKKITEDDLEQIETVPQLKAEYKSVNDELEARQEEMRILNNEIADANDRFAHLCEIMPQITKLNQQYTSMMDSLHKLDASVADINYLLPLIKDDLLIGERVESAYGMAPFSGKRIVLHIVTALVLTLLLGSLISGIEFEFGRVSGEKELMLFSALHYLGSLPLREELFKSHNQESIAFNTIYHSFRNVGSDHHIVFTGTLPGGKLMPELFDVFECNHAMSGNRAIVLDVVLASTYNYDIAQIEDTILVAHSENKGVIPVISKKFLSPSELELLSNDLQILRKTYDLIFIRHSVAMRKDRMFVEQISELCDSAMIAVGCNKTTRKNLRRLLTINKKTGLTIMTIMSDSNINTAIKHTNLEVGA